MSQTLPETVSEAIVKAVAHYQSHVLREQEEREPAAALKARQRLEEASAYLEAGQQLDEEERLALRQAVTSYIGHLSRGGYSGGPQPSREDVDAAHQALQSLERPQLSAGDADVSPAWADGENDIALER